MANRTGAVLRRLILGREPEYEVENGLYDYAATESTRTREDDWRDFVKYGRSSFIAGICFAVMLAHIILMTVFYILAVLNLSPSYVPSNPFYIILWTVGPAAVWTWSTSLKFWQFYDRKIMTLYESFAAVMMMVLLQLLRLVIKPILAVTFMIPITKEVTIGMVVGLARGTLLLFTALPTVFLGVMVGKHFSDKYTKEEIDHFVVTRDMDLRENKEFRYDLKVIKEMDTGKTFNITEDARLLHTFADGTTGTGKTSSVLTPAVTDDLDQKAFNTDFQKKEVAKRLNSGEFEVAVPFTDRTFAITKVRPAYTADPDMMRKRREDYDFLRYQVPSAGITVVAPNAAWADEVYDLAVSRGFIVNRIDPMPDDDGNPKPGFKGFNPLFVSPGLRGQKREVDITNKANIFADVLAGIFERGGGGDVYFKNLNSTWTTATCMLVMLAYDPDEDPKRHVNQPSPADIQKILNNPDNARGYLSRFAYRFGRIETLYNKKGEKIGERGGNSFAGHEDEFKQYKDQIETNGGVQALQAINCGIYQYVWDTFFRDILGARREELYDQANGLRMQVNKLLGHRYIRAALCVPDELAVDLDEMLAEGQITVVNYALELGKSVSIAFGQFWTLCYGKAVTRRPAPEKTRIPHFNYIDEFSSIVHPDIDEYFTLHRQYRCANFVALQTLDQMSKSRDTEYMRGILLGNCATQIVYGRLSTTEMDIYEKMAGKTPGSLEQDTVSQTSITSENPSYSWSRRTTMQQENRMEGSQLRYRDFQTVTVFTVRKSTPIPPFVGKVDFLPPARRKGKPRVRVDWGRFMPEDACCVEEDGTPSRYGFGRFGGSDGVQVRISSMDEPRHVIRHMRFSAGRSRIARNRQGSGGTTRGIREYDDSASTQVNVASVDDIWCKAAGTVFPPSGKPEPVRGRDGIAHENAQGGSTTEFEGRDDEMPGKPVEPPVEPVNAPESGENAAGGQQDDPAELFGREYEPPARVAEEKGPSKEVPVQKADAKDQKEPEPAGKPGTAPDNTGGESPVRLPRDFNGFLGGMTH